MPVDVFEESDDAIIAILENLAVVGRCTYEANATFARKTMDDVLQAFSSAYASFASASRDRQLLSLTGMFIARVFAFILTFSLFLTSATDMADIHNRRAHWRANPLPFQRNR